MNSPSANECMCMCQNSLNIWINKCSHSVNANVMLCLFEQNVSVYMKLCWITFYNGNFSHILECVHNGRCSFNRIIFMYIYTVFSFSSWNRFDFIFASGAYDTNEFKIKTLFFPHIKCKFCIVKCFNHHFPLKCFHSMFLFLTLLLFDWIFICVQELTYSRLRHLPCEGGFMEKFQCLQCCIDSKKEKKI